MYILDFVYLYTIFAVVKRLTGTLRLLGPAANHERAVSRLQKAVIASAIRKVMYFV